MCYKGAKFFTPHAILLPSKRHQVGPRPRKYCLILVPHNRVSWDTVGLSRLDGYRSYNSSRFQPQRYYTGSTMHDVPPISWLNWNWKENMPPTASRHLRHPRANLKPHRHHLLVTEWYLWTRPPLHCGKIEAGKLNPGGAQWHVFTNIVQLRVGHGVPVQWKPLI